jgi:threonylcarbamoyladenosine tRNA methylthiotransferase MtaB
VEEAEISFLHVFPYSERDGTPAARMPSVPRPVRVERAARLRATGRRMAEKFHQFLVGRAVSVLGETETGGHSEHFAAVRVAARPGELFRARITAADAAGVVAEPL